MAAKRRTAASVQRAQGGSDYAVLRQRAETASQTAARSGRREDHVVAAQAHVDAHAAARSRQDKAHHDSQRGQHARSAYPDLYRGSAPRAAAKPAAASDRPPPESKPALHVQQGKKGGKYVVTASGKKRYIGKGGRG